MGRVREAPGLCSVLFWGRKGFSIGRWKKSGWIRSRRTQREGVSLLAIINMLVALAVVVPLRWWFRWLIRLEDSMLPPSWVPAAELVIDVLAILIIVAAIFVKPRTPEEERTERRSLAQRLRERYAGLADESPQLGRSFLHRCGGDDKYLTLHATGFHTKADPYPACQHIQVANKGGWRREHGGVSVRWSEVDRCDVGISDAGEDMDTSTYRETLRLMLQDGRTVSLYEDKGWEDWPQLRSTICGVLVDRLYLSESLTEPFIPYLPDSSESCQEGDTDAPGSRGACGGESGGGGEYAAGDGPAHHHRR